MYNLFHSAMEQIVKPVGRFAKNYGQAAFFFPFANIFNYSHGHDLLVTKVAIFNLGFTFAGITISSIAKSLPEESKVKKSYYDIRAAIDDTRLAKNLFKEAANRLVREITDLNRVTSYCCFAVSGLLLRDAYMGVHDALLPGITAAAFGLGNYFLSSKFLGRFRNNPESNPTLKALVNPALSYGPGYATTGLTIGGPKLIAHPLAYPAPLFLTSVGIAETVGALGVMAFGKINNQAVPFVIVAGGGVLFSATGLLMGDYAGAATGALACAGELSLAVLMQKIHNGNVAKTENPLPPSLVEKVLTRPINAAMNAGMIDRYLPGAAPA